jgi:hypothetical protein
VATPPTNAETEPEPRSFRDRPLGRIALLLAVLLLAFLATKTCASRDTEIDQDEAEAIARDEVDFVPEKVLVRFVQRGLDARPYWAVSLSTENAAGVRQECATVLIDWETGTAQTDPC